MQENNTDIYCVQETGSQINETITMYDYLLLSHRIPIQTYFSKGGVEISLLPNAKKFWKLAGTLDHIVAGNIAQPARVMWIISTYKNI